LYNIKKEEEKRILKENIEEIFYNIFNKKLYKNLTYLFYELNSDLEIKRIIDDLKNNIEIFKKKIIEKIEE